MDNIYQMVTEKIIAQLKNGIIPWRKPWTGTSRGPYNAVTKTPYSLLNQILLEQDGAYATYKQWHDLGGRIKAGEKAKMIVFWKIQTYMKKEEDGTEKECSRAILRHYNVFHSSQITGVEIPDSPEHSMVQTCVEAEEVKNEYLSRSGVKFTECITNNAFYDPLLDQIEVPCKEQFREEGEYYSTIFHEIVHSTGHSTRLSRDIENHFADNKYSKEELIAEMGNAMILNRIGIETSSTIKNSAAYIQSWLRKLKNDSKFIVSASTQAEKAVHYIYGE